MRHKFLVIAVKKWLKSMYITDVAAKLKPAYHFLDQSVGLHTTTYRQQHDEYVQFQHFERSLML